MARDRTKNREKVRQEKALDRRNAYGNNDPTPYAAVERIIRQEDRAATRSA